MFKLWRDKKKNSKNEQAKDVRNDKTTSQAEWGEAFEYVGKSFGRAIEKLSER